MTANDGINLSGQGKTPGSQLTRSSIPYLSLSGSPQLSPWTYFPVPYHITPGFLLKIIWQLRKTQLTMYSPTQIHGYIFFLGEGCWIKRVYSGAKYERPRPEKRDSGYPNHDTNFSRAVIMIITLSNYVLKYVIYIQLSFLVDCCKCV